MLFLPNPLFSITSSLLLGLSLTTPASVQAAIITYDFTVDIDSDPAGGPLSDNSYSGFFSYDDTDLTEDILFGGFTSPLTDFLFVFEGISYSESDDTASEARFDANLNFLGIDYAVSPPPSPTFTSGSFDLNQAFFSYDLDPNTPGQGGTGEITYTLRPSTAVPEPSTIVGLLTLGFVGLTQKKKGKL